LTAEAVLVIAFTPPHYGHISLIKRINGIFGNMKKQKKLLILKTLIPLGSENEKIFLKVEFSLHKIAFCKG